MFTFVLLLRSRSPPTPCQINPSLPGRFQRQALQNVFRITQPFDCMRRAFLDTLKTKSAIESAVVHVHRRTPWTDGSSILISVMQTDWRADSHNIRKWLSSTPRHLPRSPFAHLSPIFHILRMKHL